MIGRFRAPVIAGVLIVSGTLASGAAKKSQEPAGDPVDFVNPFIGTTNFGTTNPGAGVPNGLMRVTPFNVMGSDNNRYDKDARWWSTPYDNTNSFFTGFAHGALSGVGCPDLGALLLTATAGKLDVDYHNYGTAYSDEQASPGWYSVNLDAYGITAETTATTRTARTRFTFPAGEGNILLNLGEGLTNESGATVRRVSPTEIRGSKLLGTFCYVADQAVYPVYFVMRVNRVPSKQGMWKKQRPGAEWEAEWNKDQGKYKLYPGYSKVMSGDDIGVWYSYDSLAAGETVEVSMAISYVSEEGALRNLEAEQPEGTTFDSIKASARSMWNDDLSRISVEGGSLRDKVVFYTGLYHALIHPNILQDVDGAYPVMESDSIAYMPEGRNRYTVFSLWDTYRNLHQLMTLVYPERQVDMINTMLDMYREHGWLPKWELYGRETLTMEGDPSIPVVADSYLRGLRGFDADLAWEAMLKGATTKGSDNLMRPDADDYFSLGYVPLREQYDNSVSHALEYYTADYALSRFAAATGRPDSTLFADRARGWTHYFDPELGVLRPRLPDGSFLTPFNPRQGENFEPSPGFHEGNSWNYSFAMPHDVEGMIKAHGGKKKFVERLQAVFDNGLYDPANEPDIIYPFLFSRVKGEEWRTHKLVGELLDKYFTTAPDGIPGNEDCGTMSAWAIWSMMGMYPDTPGDPAFTLTVPRFEKITVKLDPEVWGKESLEIKRSRSAKAHSGRISHDEMLRRYGR
ncbi:GH92 family glycosyl hydrolase [uncultured Muribaculum sp.]|uniref:GH92 family glycosyl hydrolase n=1 Tax=uncultured Muribaculum sp. TaxID=1918613 RepID=UPI0025F550E2|nr:GH92 family glycosyl hydrolase [uncultured Muribaculum sp.]